MLRILFAVLIVTAGAACHDGSTDSSVRSHTRTDSVVSVETVPLMAIGGNEEADALYDVSSALFVAGGILIGDTGTEELLFYDVSGRLLNRLGRRGSGPGEFRSIDRVIRTEDGFAAWDRRLRRLTIFDSNPLRYSAILQVGRSLGESVEPIGLHDEFVVVRRATVPSAETHPTGKATRDSTDFLLVARGELFEPTSRAKRLYRGAGEQYFAPPGRSVYMATRIPFYPRDRYAVGTEGVYYTPSNTGKVTLIRFDGSRFVFSAEFTEQRVTHEDLERARAALVAGATDERGLRVQSQGVAAWWSRTLAEAPMAGLKPQVEVLTVDGAGRLWVGQYSWPEYPREYRVFTSSGTPLFRVSFPHPLRVTDATTEAVLGVQRDDLGAQVVAAYRFAPDA